ncbi:Tetratricopeptide-like helical domain [Phytophthora cactorum]|nr:Tetratricopeptide-like helical domain [Phytophthora cactorum]
MAIKFTRAGLCQSAVETYVRMGDVKSAIDSCVLLNEWERAVGLAEQYNFPQIENVLTKYANHLMMNGKTLQAIELYRRANKSTEAAKLLAKLAKEVGKNPLRAKKLHVLAAFEVERMRKKMLDVSSLTSTKGTTAAQVTAQTLESLVQHDAATGEDRSLDNPWRGAEAYHLYLLAHRQLYGGRIDRALRTCLKLSAYEDILEEREIYSLIALTAFYTKHYEQCSKAFVKLETLPGLDDKELQAMSELALKIFTTTRTEHQDPTMRPQECPNCRCQVKEWDARCGNCSRPFPTCMMTGMSIQTQSTKMCKACRHICIEAEIRDQKNCPLCHTPFSFKAAATDKKADDKEKEDTEVEDDGDDEREESGEEEDEESDEDVEEDTGLTENQNRLLYLISMYSKPAVRASDKEEWIRKPALLVLLYEAIVSKALDYDYAPSSELVENKRKYFNISQEGKSDLDFLREEDLVNGLKLSSKSYQPVTCYQISEKGLEIVAKISKTDKLAINDMAYTPGTLHLLRVEWDGEEYWLVDDDSGYRRLSSVTETEDVSYVSSAYIPQCLRFGGRPTLSNAHRAHECGVSDSSIRDQLDEIITLNSRVQGGFFTAIVDDNASGTQISVDPGLTSINILDYTMTNHVNFEADIHFPEAPGVVQVETFGCSLTAAGSCLYGMQVEAIMDRIKDNISLDHLSRLLVDVHMDSSKIVDSINLIIANEITPHLTAEEYMDKGEYENELKQLSTLANMIPSSSERMGYLSPAPIADIMNHFCVVFSKFFARMFIIVDDMAQVRKLIETSEKDPNRLREIRNRLASLSREIIMMEETLSYLKESLDEAMVPAEPPEQAGRSLYERLQLGILSNQLKRRVKDLHKNMGGARHELAVLNEMASIVSSEKGFNKTKLYLQEINERSASTLLIMKMMLSGLLAFNILDRITGDWTVADQDWMKSFVEVMLYNNPGLWFFFSLLAWLIVGAGVIFMLKYLSFKSQGVVSIKVERKAPIQLKNLTSYLRNKILDASINETHHYEGGLRIAKVVWKEKDKKEWGGTVPCIELEYDEENAFMLRLAISYNKRHATKALAFNVDELYTRLMQEMDKARIFVDADSSASAQVSTSTGAAVRLHAESWQARASTATGAVSACGQRRQWQHHVDRRALSTTRCCSSSTTQQKPHYVQFLTSSLPTPVSALKSRTAAPQLLSGHASCPPVPQDEYDELKSFLAEPVTSGPAMERAKEIVTGWMQQYVDPAMPGQDATVMVMVADAMEDPQFVMQVYTCLRDAGVSPSPITLEYSPQLAVEIMQPSQDIYENAIASCHVAKKWMRAKHLLEEMQTYGLEASPELHIASIRLCIDFEEATATRVLLDAFMLAYDEELDEDEKQEIVTDLFHAAMDAQSLPQALFFRDELLARQYPVSKELYSRLIHLCAVKRQWHKARVLLQQFVNINARPPKAAPSDRYTDDIHRLLDEMETHDIDIPLAVYNAALRNFGQISLLEDALAVYADMRGRSVTPDATSFAALMCSCGTQVEQSESFFSELQREDCVPTLDVVHGYLLVPSRAKQWEEVLRRYDIVQNGEPLFKGLPLESDVRVQSLVAVAYGRLSQSEEMLGVFTSMKVKGMEPNLYVYGEAMVAYIRQDQWRHALMLFDHLFQQQTPEMQEKRVLENFPMLWDYAILACMFGEQPLRAAMLYDTIIEQRVPISMATGERLAAMLTSIPPETLWKSFRSIPSLHRTKTNDCLNPRVQNAVLKRAVDGKDNALAEQIVADGMHGMEILPNSMTYALMLRLYASREDQEKFHTWWCRMEEAKVKPTVYVFGVLLRQLGCLSVDCEDVTYLNTIAEFLKQRLHKNSIKTIVNVASRKEYAAELGQAVLDIIEGRGMQPGTVCLQNYLLLSQEPEHVTRALAFVEDAMSTTNQEDENSAQDCFELTPRLLHTLFTALGNFPDGQRVRNLLIRVVRDLPSELSEDAVAAFCAANDGLHALQLLRELLDAKCALNDEHVLFFLTNSYTCEASSVETETSRPRSGNGVIVDVASLLCESETVKMEAACLAFLIKHVVELSKWQQRDVYEVSTQEEIDAMKKLLVHAFSDFSITQVTEFLSKVIERDDLVHVMSVLDELQGKR